MLRLFIACLALAIAGESFANVPHLKVTNLARQFSVFWDSSQHLPPDERVAAFKQQIGAQFPAFYDLERYKGKRTAAQHNAVIDHNLKQFATVRERYLNKINKFELDLPKHLASFQTVFPDFAPETNVYVVHSLGEMDGGTRTLNGKEYLIFGIDIMTTIHGDGDESAFFHHELFHVHHAKKMGECQKPGAWEPLWREGLATYVSHTMNPTANEKELLLDMPTGTVTATRANMHAALLDLETSLDSTDDSYFGPLFTTRGKPNPLPQRRGYYLGYIVAREIGKTTDLQSLANLSCDAARERVHAAVHALKLQTQP